MWWPSIHRDDILHPMAKQSFGYGADSVFIQPVDIIGNPPSEIPSKGQKVIWTFLNDDRIKIDARITVDAA